MNKIYLSLIGAAMLSMTACGNSSDNKASAGEDKSNAVQTVAEAEGANKLPGQDDKFYVKDNVIIPEGMPVVVDFSATWCNPCKQYAPVFHKVAEAYEGQAYFISIDIDEYPDIAKEYKVSAVPSTVFILPAGGVMGKEEGVIDEARLTAFVNQLLEANAGSGNGI